MNLIGIHLVWALRSVYMEELGNNGQNSSPISTSALQDLCWLGIWEKSCSREGFPQYEGWLLSNMIQFVFYNAPLPWLVILIASIFWSRTCTKHCLNPLCVSDLVLTPTLWPRYYWNLYFTWKKTEAKCTNSWQIWNLTPDYLTPKLILVTKYIAYGLISAWQQHGGTNSLFFALVFTLLICIIELLGWVAKILLYTFCDFRFVECFMSNIILVESTGM